jgi:predicted nucleotide-binding protein
VVNECRLANLIALADHGVTDMKPRIFIGSSVEGKPIADAIQSNFTHDAYPTVWDQNIFLPSSYPIDSLLKAVANHDFGILVLSPDDVSKIRGETSVVPRGNVVFEAALFMGKHGRDRCFLVQPRNNPAFARPTDLEGIIPASYDEKHYRENPLAALGPACTHIRNAIKNSASFNRTVTVVPNLQLADPATSTMTYPKKLAFQITNSETSAVLVASRYFEMAGRLNGHASRSSGSKNKFKVEFLAYRDSSGKDFYQLEYLLRPGASVGAWLALDSATDDEAAHDALARTELGTWHITCHWLAEPMELRAYQFEF